MDVRDLYQQVILDHNRSPRNFRFLESASHEAEGFNPLCGDRVKVFVEMEGDVVKDVGFQGSGCAISTASASLMTDAIKGKTEPETRDLFRKFHEMVTATPDTPVERKVLGKLAVFAGVREFPVRVKCASLSWHTLQAALASSVEPVSTE